MKVSDFTIEPVPKKAVDSFIKKWHYSQSTRGLHISHCFGLYSDDGPFGLPRMIGAMIYGIPAMYGVAERYYEDNPSVVIELNRLCCIDDTPKNTESYFIGKTLRWLKQNTDIEVVVSFADQHYGHAGTIYKASNFDYLGETAPGQVLMVDGREMHSRSLNQKLRPYGRELKRRYDEGDPNIFFKKRKPKHIYTYYLNKKIKRQIKNDIARNG